MAALSTAALTNDSSTLPDSGELRAMATTAEAQHKRDAEEVRLRTLPGRCDGIEGLRTGFTAVSDACTGPSDRSFAEEAAVHLIPARRSAAVGPGRGRSLLPGRHRPVLPLRHLPWPAAVHREPPRRSIEPLKNTHRVPAALFNE
ncbi:hypothetical protein [Streptomyces sp. BF23-19]|uniref:hypothetical protein n=1 Tax=Streptomyces TaxID=1883 RepID=UPI0034E3D5A2|nr:hypothetical protein OG253_39990 [Streptomyces virginiae]